MNPNVPLLGALRSLRDRCACIDETTDSLSFSHPGGEPDLLHEVAEVLNQNGLQHRLSVDGAAMAFDEIASNDAWELTFAKRNLAAALGYPSDADETVVLFLSVRAFDTWALRQTQLSHGFSWPSRLTILVDGLEGSVAGQRLRCGPLDENLLDFDATSSAINAEQVLPLVQLAPEVTTRKVGQTLLTKGDIGSTSFKALRTWAEWDAGRLLCSEVVFRDGLLHVELKGGRRVRMLLETPASHPELADVELIQQAATWCFTEHRDARHSLLVDRLALDAQDGGSFLLFLRGQLRNALRDARDRYRIVVLEKKDAAAKETREVLKDVRTQADLYASKVRDLVATVLRDLLAVMLLVGLGLLGRIDSSALASIAISEPVSVFFRLLAVYFFLSGIIQVATHSRDLYLTTSELKKWWRLARVALPISEVDRLIDDVVAPRRTTFVTAAIVVIGLNVGVALALWNWRCLAMGILTTTQ